MHQKVNILDSKDYMCSYTTTQTCHDSVGVVVDQRRAHIINLCTIVHICVSISWDKHPCMYIALLLLYEGRKVDRVTSLTLFVSKIQQLKDGGDGAQQKHA